MIQYTVIIPAAGQGKRMNRNINKQFIAVGNMPVLALTLRKFQQHPHCREIIVVIHPNDEQRTRELVRTYRLDKVTHIVHGGKERQDSIHNGLQVLSSAEFVMVHDGARPFVSTELLNQLCEALEGCQGVIPAVPVKDTIKLVNNDGTVVGTLPREQLVAAQTPQAFKKDLLLQSYAFAKENTFLGTDDASLVEYFGEEVKYIMGEYDNIKITTEEDLDVAEKIFAKYYTQ